MPPRPKLRRSREEAEDLLRKHIAEGDELRKWLLTSRERRLKIVDYRQVRVDPLKEAENWHRISQHTLEMLFKPAYVPPYPQQDPDEEVEDYLGKCLNYMTDVVNRLSTFQEPTRPKTLKGNEDINSRIRSIMLDRLTKKVDIEELQRICFDLEVPYDDLPGDRLGAKALALIEFMERRGQFYELLIYWLERSSISW